MNRDEIEKLYCEKLGVEQIIEFDKSEVMNLTEKDLEFRKELVLDLIRKARRVGHPQNHVLSAIGQTSHTPYMSSYAEKSFSMYEQAIARAEEKTHELCELLNIDYPLTEKEFSALYGFCSVISDSRNIPQSWILYKNFPEFADDLGEFLNLRKECISLESVIFKSWVREIENIDADELLSQWHEISDKPSVIKKMKTTSLLKRLSVYSKSVVEPENAYETLVGISNLHKNEAAMQEIFKKHSELLPKNIRISESELEEYLSYYKTAKSISEKIRELDIEDYLPLATSENIPILQGYYSVWKTFCEVRGGIYKMFMVDPSRISFVKDYLTSQRNFCEVCKSKLDMLSNWIEWNAAKKKASENGLSKVCAAYENGMIHSVVLDAYEKGLYKALCEVYC